MKIEATLAAPAVTTDLQQKLSQLAGGCTVTYGFGSWVDDDGVLAIETVATVTVLTVEHPTDVLGAELLAEVKALVLDAAALAGEEAVAFSVSCADHGSIEYTGVKVGRA